MRPLTLIHLHASLVSFAAAGTAPDTSGRGGNVMHGWERIQNQKPLSNDEPPTTIAKSAHEQQQQQQQQHHTRPGKSNPFETEWFSKFMQERLAKWHVPGIAVGIVDGNQTWTAGFGIASYPSTPTTASTLFYGASTSKAFTAATMAIMIESGNYTNPSNPSRPLSWQTPLSDIIRDDFVLADTWATRHITIEDALSHRTGMGRHDIASQHVIVDPVDGGTRRNATVRDTVRMLRHLPLVYEPRTKYAYCNHMYTAVSLAMEALVGDGRGLGDLMKEWIFNPLGMQSTFTSVDDVYAAKGPLSGGHYWNRKTDDYTTVPDLPEAEAAGAGFVISNVQDYTKWIKMLIRSDAPLTEAAHAAIRKPRIYTSPSASTVASPYDAEPGYAFGWIVASYRGHRFWAHSGGAHAFGAEVFYFPELDFGVVALGNTAITSNYAEIEIVWQLVDDRLGVPVNERISWTAGREDPDLQIEALLDNAIATYYTDLPTERLTPALPIEAYAGTYHHPAYQNITLTLPATGEATRSNISLVATRLDATWQVFIQLEHVSGEFWMGYANFILAPPTMAYPVPLEFRLGSRGGVEAMGMTIPEAMEDRTLEEGVIWLDKIV